MNDTRSGISIRSGISTVAACAAHEFRQGDKFDTLDAPLKSVEAARARADGERLLEPPERLIGNASTELVPAPDLEANVPAGRLSFLDTLAVPNTISVDASERRAAVATRAGVLSPALDAAVSAHAKNSIEKMLCHQMAAVHMAGMELLVRLEEAVRLPPGETAVMWEVGPTRCAFDVYDVATQAMSSNYFTVDDGRGEYFSIPFRYVWPAELDLMARLAGMALHERWSDWDRGIFTSESRSHVSVWERAPGAS